MKRKDLYSYIREEIINELTTVTKNTETSEIPAISKSEKVPTATVSKAIQKAKSSGQDVDIAEARKAGGYRVGDASKFTEAKELYSMGLYADVLKAIEEAGEDGITQKELGIKLEKGDGSSLNLILNKFKAIGVLGGGKLAAASKPEKTTSIPSETEPETDEMDDIFKTDDEEKPEEEAPEEKPEVVSDKEVEKIVGKKVKDVANLSPEDEDKFNKLKKGIESKVARLKDMEAAKRTTSDDLKVLKSLIGREDVKKLFNAKGIDVKDYLEDL